MFTGRVGNAEGFTLVELLIVIAILGMLATIAIPKVKGILDNSQNKITETNALIVQNAIDMYYAENLFYPEAGDMSDLEVELKLFIEEIPEDVQENYTYNSEDGKIVKVGPIGDEE